MFRQKPKKLIANVSFDAVAVRGVESYHVSLSSSAFPYRLFLLKGEPFKCVFLPAICRVAL